MKFDLKIANSLEHCQQLWEKFSPKRILWDEWDINECFYDPKFYELRFMYTDKSLLPLVYSIEEQRHEFFGNGFVENRTFWIDETEISEFFNKIPENTRLFDMNGQAVEQVINAYNIAGFTKDDQRNFWRGSSESLLENFSKKHRNNILKDLEKINYVKFSFEDNSDSEAMLNIVVDFNRSKFGENSDFNDQNYISCWKRIVAMPVIKFLVARVDNNIVGVEVLAIYKNILYVMNGGYDADISNLGKLIMWNCLFLKDSLQLDEVDFMAGVNDWKSKFHLQSESYYSFRK